MELTHITGNTYCIDGATMSVLYKLPDGGCVLLDPGHPRDGKAIDELLIENGLTVKGVLSTHVHHDHFGNCRYFAEKYGLPVILPLGEAACCRSLHSFSYTMGFLSTWVLAESKAIMTVIGPVDETIGFEQDKITVAGVEFEVIHTPGHSLDNVCFKTPDGVLVIGDVFSSHDVLKNLRAPYTSAIGLDIESKRLIGRTDCTYCVMAHKGVAQGSELPKLAESNIAVLESMIDDVAKIVDHPMHIDEIIPLFCEKRGIRGMSPGHGMHIRHVIGTILGYLIDDKKLISSTSGGLTSYLPADKASLENRHRINFNGTEMAGR